jgi:hypothetical protein
MIDKSKLFGYIKLNTKHRIVNLSISDLFDETCKDKEFSEKLIFETENFYSPIFHKNLHEYVNKYKLDSKNMLILMNNYITSNECWSGNDEVMWRYLISTNPTLDDFKLLNPFMHIVALKVWEIPKENLLYYIGLKSLKSLSLGFLYYIFYNLPKDIVNYFVIFLGDLIDIQTLLFSMYFNTFRF